MKKGTLMKKLIISVTMVWAALAAYILYDVNTARVRPTTARIDVSEKTANAAPCFRLIDKNTGKELPEAGWMPKLGNRGYVMQKNGNSADLQINVVADNCKIDFFLRGPWELKDKNDSKKGIKEHWVEYTKFTVNGKNIVNQNTPAWHNKPLRHTITAKKGDTLNIAAKWQKHYTAQDKAERKANGIWLIVITGLLAGFGILAYRFKDKIVSCRLYQKLAQHLAQYKDFDLEQIIVSRWQNISPLAKKSFLWIFLITNLVFLFHTVMWLWGDHDWSLIKYGMTTYNMLWCGRYTGGGIQQLFGGDLLPVINNLFCFAGFTFAAIYLAKYWKIPQTPFCYTVFGLFVILMPYTCSWLWYIKQTTLFWNIFLVILALWWSLHKSYVASVAAIVLMVFSLGAYASIISTIAIVFLGRVLMDIVLEQKTLKEEFKTYLRTGVNILVSIVIFKLILMYYEHQGKLKHGDYNTDYITLSDMPEKIKLILQAIKEMFYLSLPFISTEWKVLVSLPGIYLLYRIIKARQWGKLWGIALLAAILLSSQLTNFMAKANFSHEVRIDFFAVPYIFAVLAVFCLRGSKLSKSFGLWVMIISVWLCALSDVRFQKAFYLGKEAEMRIYTDIVSRIKDHDNFNINKDYIFISTTTTGLRTKFYRDKYDKGNTPLLSASINARWNEKELYDFLESESYIKNYVGMGRQPHINSISYTDLQRIADFVFNKAQPYPHKNSVYVDDKFIYVIYDENGLRQAKQNLQRRLNELEKKNG